MSALQAHSVSEKEVQSGNNSLPGDFFPSCHRGEADVSPCSADGWKRPFQRWRLQQRALKPAPGQCRGHRRFQLTDLVLRDLLARHAATASKLAFFLIGKLVPAIPSLEAAGAAVTSLNRADILRFMWQMKKTQVWGHCGLISAVGHRVGRSAQVRSTGGEGGVCDALPVAIHFLCFNGRLKRRQEHQPPLPAAAGLLGVMQRYGTGRMQICPATGLCLECLTLASRWLQLCE